MLRTAELLDAAEIGKLRPRWEGPPFPNTYTLALPKRFKCSPAVNVARLKPYHVRPDRPAPPGPVSDPGQEGEYVVEQLLNRRILHGRTHYLVRWQGHDSTADSWEPVEHLTNCSERIAEYEAAAPRRPRTLRKADRGGAGPAAEAVPGPEQEANHFFQEKFHFFLLGYLFFQLNSRSCLRPLLRQKLRFTLSYPSVSG